MGLEMVWLLKGNNYELTLLDTTSRLEGKVT